MPDSSKEEQNQASLFSPKPEETKEPEQKPTPEENSPPRPLDPTVLRFDPADHKYILEYGFESRELPSVSKILKRVGVYNFPHTTRSVEAMNLGTFIHSLTKLYDEQLIGAEDAEAGNGREQLEAYAKFASEHKPAWHLSEVPLWHPIYYYAGSPDRFGTIASHRGNTALVEIKTGQEYPGYAVQLAAYRDLLDKNGYKVDKCFALYLQADANYRLVEVDTTEGLVIFKCALTILNFRRKHYGEQ